ncbi:MAG TPA: hypothetical protein VJJ22_00785 [Candidatus Paceibacterota bacterium]
MKKNGNGVEYRSDIISVRAKFPGAVEETKLIRFAKDAIHVISPDLTYAPGTMFKLKIKLFGKEYRVTCVVFDRLPNTGMDARIEYAELTPKAGVALKKDILRFLAMPVNRPSPNGLKYQIST